LKEKKAHTTTGKTKRSRGTQHRGEEENPKGRGGDAKKKGHRVEKKKKKKKPVLICTKGESEQGEPRQSGWKGEIDENGSENYSRNFGKRKKRRKTDKLA